MPFKIFLSLLPFLCILSCTNKKQQLIKDKNLTFIQNPANFQSADYDSIYSLLYHKTEDLNSLAQILAAKGKVLDFNLKLDSTYIEQTEQFVNKHIESTEDSLQVQLKYYLGSQLDFLGKTNNSEYWLKQSIQTSKNPNNDTFAGFAYLILGGQKEYSADLDSAQFFAYKALKVFENTKDTVNIGTIQGNLFRVKINLNERNEAKEILNRMLVLAKKTNDTLNLAQAFTRYNIHFHDLQGRNYGDSLHLLLQKWKNAPEYYHFMDASFQTLDLLAQDQKEAAKKTFLSLDKLIDTNNEIEVEQYNNTKLIYEYNISGQIDTNQYNKTLKKAIVKNDIWRATDLLKMKVSHDESINDYRNAYFNLKKQYELRDSLWTNETKANLIEFEKKYELSKKNEHIAKQKLLIQKRNGLITVLLMMTGITILLGLAIMNYRKRKFTEKENTLQEEYAESLLNSTEQERSRIAGDLHDSVNHELLTIKQKLITGSEVDPQEVSELINKVRRISHNLYPTLFKNLGLAKSVEELSRSVSNNRDLEVVSYIDYNTSLSKNQEIQIYRIIEEALNNMVKHSGASHGVIKLENTNNTLIVSVKDNGKGLSEEIQKNKKTTFGITNMKQRAKSINGQLNIMSNDIGTQLLLEVKL